MNETDYVSTEPAPLGMFPVERDPERIKRMAWEIAKADCRELDDRRMATRLAFGAERYERLAVAAAVSYRKPFQPIRDFLPTVRITA